MGSTLKRVRIIPRPPATRLRPCVCLFVATNKQELMERGSIEDELLVRTLPLLD